MVRLPTQITSTTIFPLLLLAQGPISTAEAATPTLEIQVSGGAMRMEMVESIEGQELHRNKAVGFEPGIALAVRFGQMLASGVTYERIIGAVETPELPGEWGLGANEFSLFAEIHHPLSGMQSLTPYLGIGASLGWVSLDEHIELGPGGTKLALAGSATTFRAYGIGTVRLRSALRVQVSSGYRFGSISHDDLEYSQTWTDARGRVREFDADLEGLYASLAISAVVWSRP